MSGHASSRTRWLDYLLRLAQPVLGHLSQRRLRQSMPVWAPDLEHGRRVAHLEAFARVVVGMSSWLELEGGDADEARERDRMRAAAAAAFDAVTDPESPDRMSFSDHQQRLVEAAFVAQGLLRSPKLWSLLESRVQRRVIESLREARSIQPGFNNWLMFSAIIEAFFARVDEPVDRMRIDYALRQHEAWYLGDGTYGDGPKLRWDYYNSYVIQPMLLDTLDVVGGWHPVWTEMAEAQRKRAQRYAAVLERMIAPDGSYPPIGRSVVYRGAAFQLLGQMALRRDLPAGLGPGQVREAMTRMLNRTLDAPGTFDGQGWLQPGVCGHQPQLANSYISTGSLYLASCALLPLGLPADDAFWTQPGTPTAEQVWSGQDVPVDRASD